LSLLPILADPPPHFERARDTTPYRLYRHILPSALAAAGDRSLIFLGLVTNIQTSIYDEVSALWGISWLEDLLPRKSNNNGTAILASKLVMDMDIARVNAWCARRYLGRGTGRQIASAEIQEVIDLLMRDLGLNVRRKRNWIADLFVPYRSQDYRGIVRDVVERARKGI
jgi:hypothetical protein